MKRRSVFAIILIVVMAISLLSACGSGAREGGAQNPGAATQSQAAQQGENESASPTPDQKYILRIGTGTGGVHPQNVWMDAFKEALEEATNGQIEVQLYPAGQLGNMAELIQGLRDGTVDSACIPTTYFATTFPTAATVDLSYLFDGSDQLWRVLTENDTKYEQEFIDNGVIPVAWLRAFERTLISSKKVESMSDLKNLKVWCMPSVVIQKEVELMGSVTSNIDVGELAPSMQNGTVDAAISDIALYAAQSLHSSAKYSLEAPNDPMVSIFAVSPYWFNKLPADLQETVREVAQRIVTEVEYPYIDSMKTNALNKMTSEGLEIITPSDVFLADLKDALLPQHEWFLATYPEAKEIYDEFVTLIDKDSEEQ